MALPWVFFTKTQETVFPQGEFLGQGKGLAQASLNNDVRTKFDETAGKPPGFVLPRLTLSFDAFLYSGGHIHIGSGVLPSEGVGTEVLASVHTDHGGFLLWMISTGNFQV